MNFRIHTLIIIVAYEVFIWYSVFHYFKFTISYIIEFRLSWRKCPPISRMVYQTKKPVNRNVQLLSVVGTYFLVRFVSLLRRAILATNRLKTDGWDVFVRAEIVLLLWALTAVVGNTYTRGSGPILADHLLNSGYVGFRGGWTSKTFWDFQYLKNPSVGIHILNPQV